MPSSRDCWSASRELQPIKTRLLVLCTTREIPIAHVYKRSFYDASSNCKSLHVRYYHWKGKPRDGASKVTIGDEDQTRSGEAGNEMPAGLLKAAVSCPVTSLTASPRAFVTAAGPKATELPRLTA